jgi:hypothetical protein
MDTYIVSMAMRQIFALVARLKRQLRTSYSGVPNGISTGTFSGNITDTKMGCLSFFLGGKSPSDTEPWKPRLPVVRATIQYAMATGRLSLETY